MSYCVNCGVELDKTAKKCALCGAVVVNPLQKQDTESLLPYPVPAEKLSTQERYYVAYILSILLVLLTLVTIIMNVFYFKESFWSVYSIGAFVLVFIMSALPLVTKKPFLFYITLDVFGILLYLFIVERVNNTTEWYISLAMPITLCIYILIIILTFYINKRKPGGLRTTAAILFEIGILSVCIDMSISMYIYNHLRVSWSLIVFTCGGALGLALYTTSHNKHVQNELRKRFHI